MTMATTYQGFVSVYTAHGTPITDTAEAWADLWVLPDIETWLGQVVMVLEMIADESRASLLKAAVDSELLILIELEKGREKGKALVRKSHVDSSGLVVLWVMGTGPPPDRQWWQPEPWSG